jgi:hypothetical protein
MQQMPSKKVYIKRILKNLPKARSLMMSARIVDGTWHIKEGLFENL